MKGNNIIQLTYHIETGKLAFTNEQLFIPLKLGQEIEQITIKTSLSLISISCNIKMLLHTGVAYYFYLQNKLEQHNRFKILYYLTLIFEKSITGTGLLLGFSF